MGWKVMNFINVSIFELCKKKKSMYSHPSKIEKWKKCFKMNDLELFTVDDYEAKNIMLLNFLGKL
jgi:hypothetical protein